MFLIAVMIVALALLFGLTALALGAADQLRHPWRVALILAFALLIGVAMLYEYSAAS